MSTPALKKFLTSTGRTVHHLNTIVVGLSGVESGQATKPASLDISWTPTDLRTSSRQARQFLLRSTMVFFATSFSTYVETVARYPGFARPLDWGEQSKAGRLVTLNQMLGHSEDCELLGGLLIIHWRNKSVHPGSNATLSSRQRGILTDNAAHIQSTFKNLDVERLLADFRDDKPTLKEVSSLIAMSIRLVKRLDISFPPPSTKAEVEAWLVSLALQDGLIRARKTAQSIEQKRSAAETYLRTHCPLIVVPYLELVETVS